MTLNELNSELEYGMRVFRHYLGHNIRVGKHYASPFGHEGRDSFHLYIRPADRFVCFKDFGIVEMQGSCYDYVMKMFGVDFKESIKIIKRDVLGLSVREIEGGLETLRVQAKFKPMPRAVGNLMPETVTIKAFARTWTKQDLEFFGATGITEETLAKYHCYPLQNYIFSKGNKAFTISTRMEDPMYGYHAPLTDHWKIYRPFAADKRYKWISNTDATQDVFGWDTLPERTSKLYICAGQRDTMAMHQLTGLPCICLNSETAKITPELYQLLTCVADEIYCCMDNDETGEKARLNLRYEWSIYDAGKDLLESADCNDLSQYIKEALERGDDCENLAHHFATFSVLKQLT